MTHFFITKNSVSILLTNTIYYRTILFLLILINTKVLFSKYKNIINCRKESDKIMDILKVSSKSNPNKVAGALTNVFRDKGTVEVQAIGAGALNQAIKAIAISRGFVAPSGKNLVCIPAFSDITIDGEERTAIKLIVEAE